MNCSLFLTRYGSGYVFAESRGIVKVELPDLSRNDQLQTLQPELRASELTMAAARLLQSYFQGENVDFCGLPVDLGELTPFRKRVLTFIRNISYGEIRSYGDVASGCSSPKASRAVGGALAANPVPVIIPCHRVIASDGRLTGFSAPGGVQSKKALLEMEGVEFKGMLAMRRASVMHRIVS